MGKQAKHHSMPAIWPCTSCGQRGISAPNSCQNTPIAGGCSAQAPAGLAHKLTGQLNCCSRTLQRVKTHKNCVVPTGRPDARPNPACNAGVASGGNGQHEPRMPRTAQHEQGRQQQHHCHKEDAQTLHTTKQRMHEYGNCAQQSGARNSRL